MKVRIEISRNEFPLYEFESDRISVDGANVDHIRYENDTLTVKVFSDRPAYVVSIHPSHFLTDRPWHYGTTVASYIPSEAEVQQ